MPIEFQCQSCRKLLRVGDSAGGKRAKCPECGTINDVPAPAAPAPFEFSAESPVEQSPFGRQRTSGESFAEPFQRRAPGPENDNPYASPNVPQPARIAMPPSAPALERVSGPAMALIVMGAIGALFAVGGALFNLLAAGLGIGEQDGELLPFAVGAGLQVVGALVGLAKSGVMIYGGLQMKNLQSHSLAMTAAILAVIPCISSCCCLEIPFGIWALMVLNEPEVRNAFHS